MDWLVNGPDPTSQPGGQAKEAVPPLFAPSLISVAASIKRCTAGMSQWSLEDLTLGLYRLSCLHASQGVVDTIPGSRVEDRQQLSEMLHWLRWAMAAYETDTSALAGNLGIHPSFLLKHVPTSALHKPAFFLAVDPSSSSLVLSIRGTHSATDALTDLTPHSEPLMHGFAHSGMLGAAKWVVDQEMTTMARAIRQHNCRGLVVTGHSLGAGSASLITLLLQQQLRPLLLSPSFHLHCWAYACPPCVSLPLCESSMSLISTVVLQDDVVSRLSPQSLEDLRQEILSTDWTTAFGNSPSGQRLLSLAASSRASLSSLESHFGLSQGQISAGAQKLLGAAALHVSKSFSASVSSSTTASASAGGAGRAGGGAGSWWAIAGAVASVVADKVSQAERSLADAERLAPGGEGGSNSSHESRRLYAPGTLFHIIRKPPASAAASQFGSSSAKAWEAPGLGMGSSSSSSREAAEVQSWLKEEQNMAGRGLLDSSEPSSSGTSAGGSGSTGCSSSQVASWESCFVAKKGSMRAAAGSSGIENPPQSCFVVQGQDGRSRLSKIVLSSTLLSDHSCRMYGQALVAALQQKN